MADEAANKPDFKSPIHENHNKATKVIRDVVAGVPRIREESEIYLPRFPKEGKKTYENRVSFTTLLNATRRTVSGLSGMVFRKELELSEETSPEIVESTEDFDLAGTSLAEFAKSVFEAGEVEGHSIVVVDMDQADPEEIQSLVDEDALRPYASLVRAHEVLRHRTFRDRGRTTLSSFAWSEWATERKGEFGEEQVERIRQFDLVTVFEPGAEPRRAVEFRVWQKEKGDKAGGQGDSWKEITPDNNISRISRIPIAVFYTEKLGVMTSHPPLRDLAEENIRHLRITSDNDNLAHIAKVPIFTVIGGDPSETTEIEIGATVGLNFEDPNVTVGYTQPDSSNHEAFRKDERDSERRMALLGLSQLLSESRAAETAESKRIDKAEQDSNLARWVRNLEGTFREVFRIWDEFEAAEPLDDADAASAVTFNRDFLNRQMSAQEITAFAMLVETRKLSLDTFWDLMVQGEWLPSSFDPEIELAKLEAAEPPEGPPAPAVPPV